MKNISSVLLEYKKESNRIQNKCILVVNVQEKLSELVGRRIRELNLKNADLARLSGLSRSYIGNIVNETAPTQSGQYNLSPASVSALAKALEISETEILNAIGYSPDKTNDSHEILDGVMVSFDEKKFTKAEKEQLIEAMKLIAAGVKARKEESK